MKSLLAQGSKLTVLTLTILSLIGCSTSEKEQPIFYSLGYPKKNNLVLTTASPIALVDSNLLFESNQTVSVDSIIKLISFNEEFVNEKFSSATRTMDLLKNHCSQLDLQTDKDWIVGINHSSSNPHAFAFVHYQDENFLKSYLKSHQIAIDSSTSINIARLDTNNSESQWSIAFQKEKLLFFEHSDQSFDTIKSLISYGDTSEVNYQFKKDFPHKSTSDICSKLIIGDIFSETFGMSHFGITDTVLVNLSYNNSSLDFSVTLKNDSILNATFPQAGITIANQGLFELSMKTDIKPMTQNLDFWFEKLQLYKQLGIDKTKFLLSKKTAYSLLKQTDGSIHIIYNGMKTVREKSISYEFDEEFNEVEIVRYTSHQSHDFETKIGLSNKSKLKEIISSSGLLSEVNPNVYELPLYSNVQLSMKDSTLSTTNWNYNETRPYKFYLGLYEPASVQKVLQLDTSFTSKIKTMRLFIDTKNTMHLTIDLDSTVSINPKELFHKLIMSNKSSQTI